MRKLKILITIVSLCLLYGCSTPLTIQSAQPLDNVTPDISVESQTKGWWYVRFTVNWEDKDSAPLFHLDALLAEHVLVPVINRYSDDLSLWRFHRRAADDAAGHQFSFIFYASKTSATAINQDIEANALVTALQHDGWLERVRLARTDIQALSVLEGTSDKQWPLAIQRSWPYFIMGVSQTWVMLIHAAVEEAPPKASLTTRQLVDYFEGINKQVTGAWQSYGAHAYLHHLNAIFGYEPLLIHQGSYLKRF